jgi:1-acyl-sn-glycerol-3-phosphate acyltransferase
MSRFWARIMMKICGVKLETRGLEKVDQSNNYVFVGNHLSFMDTPVVLATIPQQFLFLVNVRFVKLPFLGWHLQRTGHLAVDAADMRASLKVMTEAAKRIEDRKLSVLLFPEGTRSKDGTMKEFKEGAAYIAIKSGATVVPFALRGTAEIIAVGSLHVRPGKVQFLVGDPISTAGLTLKDRAVLTEQMRAAVVGLLDAK